MSPAVIIAVSCSARHTMRKPNQLEIRLVAGLGVEGDAHSGTTVRHRSRVARNPNAPNLRQVHLIHSELHDELRAKGYTLIHDSRTEPWGQVVARLQMPEGPIVGISYAAHLHASDAQ